MDYQYYSILTVHISAEYSEWFQKYLYQKGCLGLESNLNELNFIEVKSYWPEDFNPQELFANVDIDQSSLRVISHHQIGLLKDRYTPCFEDFELIPGVRVFPAMVRKPNLKIDPAKIYLKPGMAFGTGMHTTTKICANLLSNVCSRTSLLDIGTGSGILAILSKKLGFTQVDAVEISEEARKIAFDNFSFNQTNNIRLFSDLKQVSKTYSLIIANMLAPTLLYLKNSIATRLECSGEIIVSGITQGEKTNFIKKFDIGSLQETFELNGWIGFHFKV